jgi:hypothetical protein
MCGGLKLKNVAKNLFSIQNHSALKKNIFLHKAAHTQKCVYETNE